MSEFEQINILLTRKRYSFKSDDGKIFTGSTITFYERSTKTIITASTPAEIDLGDKEDSILPCYCQVQLRYEHKNGTIKCKLEKIEIGESV